MQVVKQLNLEEKITVVHITHNKDEALEADRLIDMNDGKIILDGKPADVFAEHKLLTKIKLGVPCVTQLAVTLSEAGIAVDPRITDEEALVDSLCKLL